MKNAQHMTFLLIIMAFLLFLGACRTYQGSQPITPKEGFDWQGHRGARGLMPENSIPAFLEALKYDKVGTLELDLAVSKDHKLIVSHEPWFNGSICVQANGDTLHGEEENPNFWLYNLTSEEIRSFDCGSIGNPRFPNQNKQKTYKPTLEEVVLAVAKAAPLRSMNYNIEIKSQPAYDGKKTPRISVYAALVVEELKRLGIAERTTVQSFDVRALQEVRKLSPNQTLALLIEKPLGVAYNLRELGFTPQIYSPYYRTVTKTMVRNCQAHNMKLIPWTVNDVPTMRRLIKKGVDGIITDYPNLIEEVSVKN